jgi:hypothetical protein
MSDFCLAGNAVSGVTVNLRYSRFVLVRAVPGRAGVAYSVDVGQMSDDDPRGMFRNEF